MATLRRLLRHTVRPRARGRSLIGLFILLLALAGFIHQPLVLGDSPASIPGIFFVYDPLDGEVMSAMQPVRVFHTYLEAAHLTVAVGNDLIAMASVDSTTLEVLINFSDLPNGPTLLRVTLYGRNGEELATDSVCVTVSHPSLEVEVIEDSGTGSRMIVGTISEQHPVERFFTAYLVWDLIPTYSPDHDLFLPFDIHEAIEVYSGNFPSGHGGDPTSFQLSTSETTEAGTTLYMVVITWRPGTASLTNMIELGTD